MAIHRDPSRNFSGHESSGQPTTGRRHAFWWPVDEDGDGFIDHVMVWAPDGFEPAEAAALRRLTRLSQRGGRPDLLVTPTFVGQETSYGPWLPKPSVNGGEGLTTTFTSATPYFCPVYLSHGSGRSGRLRPVTPEIVKSLRIQGEIKVDDEIQKIDEIVFDFAPKELKGIIKAKATGHLQEPIPPRQFFPAIVPPSEFPPLPTLGWLSTPQFRGSCLKKPDDGFPFGLSIGLTADNGTRFIRAASFCRRRGNREAKGIGRMFRIEFRTPRSPRPFAIGDQCHYGLGLFMPQI
jgi:hypothetical protein